MQNRRGVIKMYSVHYQQPTEAAATSCFFIVIRITEVAWLEVVYVAVFLSLLD